MLIGEVSRLSGVSARMLRHYDRLGIVSPGGRTAGDYRTYSPADVERLFHVEMLRSLGLTLEETKAALAGSGFTPGELIDRLIDATAERITREEELLTRLRQVRSSGPTDWAEALTTVSLLRALHSGDASHRQQVTLASTDPPSATILVEALAAESDPQVAGALRWALARSGQEAITPLRAALTASDSQTRRKVVEALRDIDDPDASALLIERLGDPDADVRGLAAVELGARGAPGAVPELIAMVVAGRRDIEASEALGALAATPPEGHPGPRGDQSIIGMVTKAVADELARPGVSEPARIRLTQTLAELPGEGAMRALRRLSGDPQRPVALTARAILHTRESPGD